MSGATQELLESPKSGAPKIKILHEPTFAEPFVVLSKPQGLPSAPLVLGDPSALTECARLFPKVQNVCGKKAVEGGLLHRIDTATRGLLLVAESQEFYDHVIAAQEKGLFVKGYKADCDIDADNAATLGGFPPLSAQAQKAAASLSCGKSYSALCGLELSSYFRPFGKGGAQVRPVLPTSNAAALKKLGSKKLYSTKISAAEFMESGAFRAECKIAQGYRHQVRCHLAWLGFPVRGDRLYNRAFYAADGSDSAQKAAEMRFAAVSLEFPDLFSDKIFKFSLD